MEIKKGSKIFKFESDIRWTQARECTIFGEGKPDLAVSSPPEFKGTPGLWSPEDMFVASVNVCLLMTFLAYSRHKNLELVGYECPVEGALEYSDGKYRFTEITLHPRLTLKSQEEVERARTILMDAHSNCLISNSIVAEVKMFPDFEIASSTT